MSEAIACPSCLKRFRWTPKLAGRRVQCHCGQKFVAPDAPGGPVVPVYETGQKEAEARKRQSRSPRETYDLAAEATDAAPQRKADLADADRCPDCNAPVAKSAVVCVRCGFNLAAGQKLQTAVGIDTHTEPDASAESPVVADDTPADLAFGSSPIARALATRADEFKPSMLRESYLPKTLLALGVIGLLGLSWYGTKSLGEAGLHLLQNSGIAALSVLAVIGALLIAASLLELALGELKPAVLKCVAAGLFGSFAADTITLLVAELVLMLGIYGIPGLLCVIGFLNAMLVGLPLLYFFELDFQEAGLTTLFLVVLKSAGFIVVVILFLPA